LIPSGGIGLGEQICAITAHLFETNIFIPGSFGMAQTKFAFVSCVALALAIRLIAAPQPYQDIVYKTAGSTSLHAHLFRPETKTSKAKSAAIVLFHGGGWNVGSADWTDDDAKHYAKLGMIALSGDYRLSDQKEITPLDAMSDARDLIRWVRKHADELQIDPQKIAAYGVSAGGHLAVSAAVFPHPEESAVDARPNALVLLSPAVSLTGDNWPRILLIGKADIRSISPLDNIHGALPPTLIVNGDSDTETPLAEAERFRKAAVASASNCDLVIYQGVGHLLTRSLDPHAQEMGPFDIDPADMADAHVKIDAFLAKLGYTRVPKQ
jgi:acetyl esterase/lipase